MAVRGPWRVVAVAVVVGLGTTGCLQLAIEGAKKALEDRSTENQVTDTKVTTGILSRLSGKDKVLLIDINVDVWEGRVMLSGTVADATVRREVVALTGADQRIRALYDEIQVVSKEEQARRREEKKEEESELRRTLSDAWISTKIEAQLIAARGVTAVNYRWRVVRKHVCIVGRARSQAELDKVLQILRETDGVARVTHFVEIKPIS